MSPAVKKKIIRRLKTAEGQVRGLMRMVEDDTYCIDVITQVTAVRHALSAVEDVLLENHLATHVVAQMKGGEHQKAAREILNVYKLSKKK